MHSMEHKAGRIPLCVPINQSSGTTHGLVATVNKGNGGDRLCWGQAIMCVLMAGEERGGGGGQGM